MKTYYGLNLLALTFLLASTIPAAAVTNPAIVGSDQQAHEALTRNLDILGPVKTQDTIDYDDGLNT